ncbi:MAG: PstS family phosphate ABC transporter substrate-binding protein, partial [Verrucomicrobiota bacterium]
LEENDLTRWSDLGLTAWETRSIKPVAVRPRDGGIALDMFRHTVLRSPSLKTNVSLFDERQQLIEYLLRDDSGIGLASYLPDRPGIKVMLLSRTSGGQVFSPTPRNIHAGDYPLSLPFYVVFESEERARLAPVLRVLLGEQTAQAITAGGLVPVPENVRQQALLDVDLGI